MWLAGSAIGRQALGGAACSGDLRLYSPRSGDARSPIPTEILCIRDWQAPWGRGRGKPCSLADQPGLRGLARPSPVGSLSELNASFRAAGKKMLKWRRILADNFPE